MEQNSPQTPAEWGAAYRAKRSHYERFAEKLDSLLRDLLDAAEIEYALIEHRAKEVDSFEEKIKRRDGRYENQLTDVTDLAGVRVTVYFLEAVDAVGDLIRASFEVDDANSPKKATELDADRFGYLSDHYVVTLDETRRDLGEWAAFTGSVCEIQVRTVLQHAWATIDHKLAYKGKREVPLDYRRSLFRVSALLEVADREFEAVHRASEETTLRYEQEIASGQLDQRLDADSLVAYVQRDERAKRLVALARSVGYEYDPDADTLNVLVALELSGIKTVAALDALLASVETDATKIFEQQKGAASDYVADDVHLIGMIAITASDIPTGVLSNVLSYDDFYWQRIQGSRRAVSSAPDTA
jgi:putative GTP pyrophosphokinase